ncbi:hypothetical protein U9M48_040027, partial [Paspalum notatum var. saurae]
MATGGNKPPSLDADVDMADLASLDAPAASSASAAGAASTRFRPRPKGKPRQKAEAQKPQPVAVPKPETEPEVTPAAPLEDDRDDAMEVDGAVDAAGLADGAAAGDAAVVRDGAAATAAVEEEEEDFVVREIDVYFNPKPFDDDTKLYIMQYPLRPCWRPYDLNEICEEVRVKPSSSEVEVDLSINTQSENYDQEAPLRLTKQTLSSSMAADVADYAVGVLKGNLVYLNHIDAVVQLRPSLSHVFSGRAQSRQALQPRETNGGVSGSVATSLKGNEHERLEDSKDQAGDYDPWISLTHQEAGGAIATKYHDKMISNEGGPIDFTMS